ncbi:carbohydrate kinase [Paenarthrobacter sp. CM16]|uniref:carbohydrate kinase family protein n=1 Tax=Paenarthrobacter sp. CM16 TaxID=2738447 RepID=UPI001556AD57|nr:carbohydrate kinase [Paenarthrobacter sp. CM16]NQD86879.1 carbohydrate kinase [Paenarthrobacter sp. CM16]
MNTELSVSVIGEALVDIINDPRSPQTQTHPGGSPLNVAVGASRLGLRTTLVAHYADDTHGASLEKHLRSNNVDVIKGGSAPTSTAIATLGADGAATYTFDISWDLDDAWTTAAEAVRSAGHVHTGSIASVLAPGDEHTLSLVGAAREWATVSFDPNCRPAISPDVELVRPRIEQFVAASDIVKASDEDLLWLYPDRTPLEALEAWLDLGPAVVALTRGAAGPVILTRQVRVEMPAVSVVVVDTVGAGDSFMAGLMSALAQLGTLGAVGREKLNSLSKDELSGVAAYANRAAAITCSRAGANLPTAVELGSLFPCSETA